MPAAPQWVKSYIAPVFDNPSGRIGHGFFRRTPQGKAVVGPDGFDVIEIAAAIAAGLIEVQEIGERCVDVFRMNDGSEAELPRSRAEYDAIRGSNGRRPTWR